MVLDVDSGLLVMFQKYIEITVLASGQQIQKWLVIMSRQREECEYNANE